MSNLISLRNEIETVLSRQLAPELGAMGARQVYIVLASELGLRCHGRFLGQFHPRGSVWMHDEIGERWDGIGPAWIVDDEAIAQDSRGSQRIADRLLWGVCIHEAAHAVLIPTCFESLDFAPEADALLSENFRKSIRRTTPEREARATAQGLIDHSLTFCHVALHMARRLWHQRGVSIELTDVLANGPGRLPLDEVWWHLRREFLPLMNKPLGEIAAMAIPRTLQLEWDSAASVAAGIKSAA